MKTIDFFKNDKGQVYLFRCMDNGFMVELEVFSQNKKELEWYDYSRYKHFPDAFTAFKTCVEYVNKLEEI